MSSDARIYRRVLRRETHASRSLPAAAVAAVVAIVIVLLLSAGVWYLADPTAASRLRDWVAPVTTGQGSSAASAVIAAGAAVIGLALTLAAVLPGRLARRGRVTDRAALIVDDGVIADSVARSVGRRVGVPTGQVRVVVGRRAVSVRITPTSGVPVDSRAAEDAAGETVRAIGFPSAVRVAVAAEGVVA